MCEVDPGRHGGYREDTLLVHPTYPGGMVGVPPCPLFPPWYTGCLCCMPSPTMVHGLSVLHASLTPMGAGLYVLHASLTPMGERRYMRLIVPLSP